MKAPFAIIESKVVNSGKKQRLFFFTGQRKEDGLKELGNYGQYKFFSKGTLEFYELHPRKMNMEAKYHPIEKRTSSSQPPFLGSFAVNFPRCFQSSTVSNRFLRQFRYRWTENFLHSALVDAKPGKNMFTIAGQPVQATHVCMSKWVFPKIGVPQNGW